MARPPLTPPAPLARIALIAGFLAGGATAQDPPAELAEDLVLWSDGEGDAVRVRGRTFLDVARGDEHQGEVRQLRLQLPARFGQRWRSMVQVELTKIDRPLLEAWLEARVASDVHVKAGHHREPGGIEAFTPLNALPFLERSLPSQVFPAGRNRGVSVRGGEELRWAAGLFERAARPFGPGGPETGWVARTWTALSPGAEDQLHLGAWVGGRDAGDGALGWDGATGSLALPDVIDTGELFGARASTLGLEASWQRGPATLQAEWFVSQVDPAGAAEGTLEGGYVSLAWLLDDVRRTYRPGRGGWGLVPVGDRRVWELAGRASWIDLDDGGISGGAGVDLDLGVNLLIGERSRVMLHAVRTDLEGAPPRDLLMIRLHAGF